MDCWSRFGMRALLTCPRYADRIPGVKAELRRVGLDAGEVEGRYIPGWRGLDLAHAAVWRRFLESGTDTLLVVEDDVRFLRDMDRLAGIVDALPGRFDEARLCWGGARGDAKAARGQPWAPVLRNRQSCYMCACYALSRRAADLRLRAVDEILASGRPPQAKVDLRMGDYPADWGVYVAVPPAAVVSAAAGVSGESARPALVSDAREFGMDDSDYAR